MSYATRALLCLSACLLLGISPVSAEEKTLEKLTLKPGEKKTFTIKATSPAMVGFNTELEIADLKKCKHSCVALSAPALGSDFTIASAVGTSIEVPAKDGQIAFIVENVEAFPIPVEIFTK